VSTGAQIASLLTLGAAGVALGTRFLYTPECVYTPAMKDVLIKADHNATARGLAFDEVNRTMGWPPKHDGRAIANGIWLDKLQGVELEERMRRHDEGKANGKSDRLVIWAGVGVGLTNEIKPTSVCSLFNKFKLTANLIDPIRMWSTSCTTMQCRR